MNDPRERIETEQVEADVLFLDSQTVDKTAYWWIGMRDPHEGAVPWPELVELAQKILAANEAWLDSQTPTLEELRARYPKWRMNYEEHSEQFSAVVDSADCPGNTPRGTGPCRRQQSDWLNTEGEALRWLAAKLEELT